MQARPKTKSILCIYRTPTRTELGLDTEQQVGRSLVSYIKDKRHTRIDGPVHEYAALVKKKMSEYAL